MEYTWKVRVRGIGTQDTTVYSRNHAFSVGGAASFRPTDRHPSAVEYLLGALGADVTSGFQLLAARQGIVVDALELTLSGRLENPLVFLGVVGETGSPGVAQISGVLYVSADADETILHTIWQSTLARSPLYNTLKPGVVLDLELRLIP
ncbi:MAG TPA: OsmC family protein [Chloroflexia bacterium]|nr:OsmC family protein [Chloroflexia bacterium]